MKNIQKQFNSSFPQAGFTLVELMVSLTLFTIVVLAVVGSLYTVNNSSRKVQAMRIVIDNLNFGIESMSRTIRTGNTVACGGETNLPSNGGNPNCPFEAESPSNILYIDSTLGVDQKVEYKLYTDATTLTGTIQKRTQELGSSWTNWIAITAPEINVEKLSFYVNGSGTSDAIQPSVMIFIQGIAVAGEETQPFAIQTYLSQRAIE